MSDRSRANDLVKRAETGLRELMGKALAEKRYRDLAAVAPLADGLAELLASASGAAETLTGSAASSIAPRGVRTASPVAPGSRRPAKDDDYPRFKRDGDKLVKIAWSKKDRKPYEHRAPKATVFRVAEILCGVVRPGHVFRMDKLLPFKDTAGKEFPSYQAYVALAWFRKMGAVEEKGKDGYAVVDGLLEREQLSETWQAL